MPCRVAEDGHSAPGDVLVSVLVPVLDEAEHLVATARAMLAQRTAGRMELIFVDGGSGDGSRAILEDLARDNDRIRVLYNPARQTPSALNVGLRHARGEFVARMDAHTFYPDRYLQAGIDRLRAGGTDWVSGPAVPRPRGRVSAAVTFALDSRLGRGGSRKWAAQAGGGSEAQEVVLDTGVFAGVWRREKLLEVGGWDENWWRNQDSEMAARFLSHGSRLVCLPEMAAEYLPRDTLRGLAYQYYQYGFFRLATTRRHPGSFRRSGLLPSVVVLTGVAAADAPAPLRHLARAGATAYLLAVASGGIGAARKGAPLGVAATVPVALVVMHAGHGLGFLRGCARLGIPWRAFLIMAGTREAPGPGGETGAVHAPSLTGMGADREP